LVGHTLSVGARALFAVLVLCFVAGCGEDARHVGDLRVTGEIRPKYEHRPAPPRGPPRGISGVAFADELLGVGIAVGDVVDVGAGVGQLQVTTDGGETWRPVFRRPRLTFDDVAFVGRRHIVALGATPTPKEPLSLTTLVFRSDDGGRTWRRVSPRLLGEADALSLRFVTPRLGFAFSPPGSVYERHWLFRTTDGGRTWQTVRKPEDAGSAVSSIDFVDSSTGYATSPRRCGAGLFRTDDGGETWRGVPGSCIHGMHAYSVDFVDSRRGFLAGGTHEQRMVLATSDGGRTWTTRSGEHALLDDWLRVEFDPSGRVGWGLRGECDPFHPPCGPVPRLWRTSDGGATWQRQKPQVVQDFDMVDATHVWTFGSGTITGVLWRTTDGGHSWERLAESRGVGPDSVSFAGPRVVVETLAGYFGSNNSGHSWRWLDVTFPRGSTVGLGRVAPNLAYIQSHDGRWVWLSAGVGRRWRQVRLPVDYPSSIAFADLRTGIVGSGGVAYTTADGGQSWTRRRLPFAAGDDLFLDAAPGLITETGGFNSRRFALSRDGGVTWRIVELPRGYRNVGAWPGRGHTIRLFTERVGRGSEQYLSFDGGNTWKQVRGTLPDQIAQEGNEAWGVGVEQPSGRHLLWHSTDGGRRWTEFWPRPPATG
jgi:photosystem II stability/assembly factor-like uncharacterized protein